ncbi:MAG: hypothetical protein V3W51_00715 [Candidatus Brocadiales bacterium]
MNNVTDKNLLLFRLCFAFLLLCCHGCLFGGEKKEKKAAYPVTTMKPPKKELEKEPVERPVRQNPPLKAFGLEMDKRFRNLSREMKETQEDLLTRVTALEVDSQELSDTLLLVEFFQEESVNEMANMQERLEFELEALREQIEDYNALLVTILDRISSVPDEVTQPEEPSP